jgi:hypothetical protein
MARDRAGRGVCAGGSMPEDARLQIVLVRPLWCRYRLGGLPRAEVGLDAVGGEDRITGVKQVNCAAKPDPGEPPVVDEASDAGLPGVAEEVEAFVQAKLRTCLELGGAPSAVVIVDVANDGGEVAIAVPNLAAACMTNT